MLSLYISTGLSHCIHTFYVNLAWRQCPRAFLSMEAFLPPMHYYSLTEPDPLPFFTCYTRRKGFSEELPQGWKNDYMCAFRMILMSKVSGCNFCLHKVSNLPCGILTTFVECPPSPSAGAQNRWLYWCVPDFSPLHITGKG